MTSFTGNLYDLQLRQNIKLWQREQPTRIFQQVRKEVQRWVDEDSRPPRRSAVAREATIDDPLDQAVACEVKETASVQKVVSDLVAGQKLLMDSLQTVLAQIPKFGDLLPQKTQVKPRNSKTSSSGFIRVDGKYAVLVPPNSVASTAVTGPACGPNALVEPLSVPVPRNIQVANDLVDGSKMCLLIQVVNPTPKNVWLQPWTRLGTVRGAVKVTSGEQLEFDVGTGQTES